MKSRIMSRRTTTKPPKFKKMQPLTENPRLKTLKWALEIYNDVGLRFRVLKLLEDPQIQENLPDVHSMMKEADEFVVLLRNKRSVLESKVEKAAILFFVYSKLLGKALDPTVKESIKDFVLTCRGTDFTNKAIAVFEGLFNIVEYSEWNKLSENERKEIIDSFRVLKESAFNNSSIPEYQTRPMRFIQKLFGFIKQDVWDTINEEVRAEIIVQSSVMFIGSPRKTAIFLKYIFELSQTDFWNSISVPEQKALLLPFASIHKYQSFRRAKRFIHYLENISKTPEWNSLDSESKGLGFQGFGQVDSVSNIEKAKIFLKHFFQIVNDPRWKKAKQRKEIFNSFFLLYHHVSKDALGFIDYALDVASSETFHNLSEKHRKFLLEELVKRWNVEPLEYVKDYINTILKLLKNGVNPYFLEQLSFEDRVAWAIHDTLERYQHLVSKGRIGELDEFPEIFSSLVLVYYGSQLMDLPKLLQKLSKDEFDSLFSQLADTNPELVQHLGEQLFGRDAA